MSEFETCARCRRLIGPQEQTYAHANQVLCADCYRLLSGAAAPADAGPARVHYGSADPAVPAVPGYLFVWTLGLLHMILGGIATAFGLLLLFAGVVMGFSTRSVGSAFGSLAVGWMAAFYFLIIGLAAMGFGQLLWCIRDIARNSFRRP